MLNKNEDSIALVFSGLYIGGAEKLGISLANKFVSTGKEVYIILFKKLENPYLKLIDKRIEIVYIPRNSKYNIFLSKSFNAEIVKRQVNKVIFFCLTPLFLTRIFTFSRIRNVSYFISLHSTKPVSKISYLRTLLYLNFVRNSDKVIFICESQKQYKKKWYLFSPKRHQVIYNGVDTEYYKPGNLKSIVNKKEAMQISEKNKVIIMVATLRPEKGHAIAIKALHILHSKYKDHNNTSLIFIGGGEINYINQLYKLVEQYNLQNFVHFEGNQNDVRPYYEIADIFTLTSTSVETFSIAALEAMCYGLPISLSDIGGASEMVIEGKNGLLSKVKDAHSIASTWSNLLQFQKDKTSIREFAVTNFSLDPVFVKYLEAISL